MDMRTPLTGRIGIGLVLVGAVLLVCVLRWLAPQPLVALDMPVSLSPGHITTGTFSVHPDTWYYIDIETDKRFSVRPECEPRSVLKTQFFLSSDDGHYVQQGDSPWEYTGLTIADLYGQSAYGESTRYAFDAQVLPGASCLNAGNPRLKVQTHPSPNEAYVASIWFAVLSVGTGLFLVIRPHVGMRLDKLVSPSILGTGDIELHPVRRAPLPRMSLPAVPLVGFLYAQVSLLILTVFFLIFSDTWRYHRPPVGLFAINDLSSESKSRSCGEDWVIRIDKRENWYLNSTKTSPQELVGLLRQQLGGQTNCAVYLDVDPSLTYEVAIQAIDEIQTTQAKAVVLLTPKTKRLATQ
jgi:biopolymer transport protein ExbD